MESGPIVPSAELKRKPGLAHALIVLLGTALILGIGYGLLKIKAEVLLIAAAALAGGIGRWLGLSWVSMQSGMLQSILKGMPAMMIVIVGPAMMEIVRAMTQGAH